MAFYWHEEGDADDEDPIPDDALRATLPGGVECCGQMIGISVAYWFQQQGDHQYLRVRPDMSEMYAHAWLHDANA